MIPVLSDHYVDDFEGDQEVDHLGSSALWNIFRDLGFISVLGFEDCDYRFPISMGRRPHADAPSDLIEALRGRAWLLNYPLSAFSEEVVEPGLS